ncbi:SSI family serine proteinase inhibitor [Streptomyces sp. NPDC058620]|uniref:SSI family serine proteinase inhibitor n=1 Tax=Streptomyces sp. NPDC058620 TaxID=3346560 RepID=UPI00365C3461
MNKLPAAVAAVLLGIGLAGTAHASSTPAPAPADATSGAPVAVEESELTLAVSGSQGTWTRAVVLTCPAADPGHPEPTAACAELAEAGGDFDALPGDRHQCTKEYDPVTAEASGTYQGRPVSWSRTYPNACVLDSATGTVFRF